MKSAIVALLLAASSPLGPAREAYQSGDLPRARTELEALLQPSRLSQPREEAEAHLLLAATLHAQEDLLRAEHEAVEGLALDSAAKLDPLVYPPDFIAFVERVRARRHDRIAGRAARLRAPALLPAPAASTAAPVLVESRPASRGWYLVPFGVGHLVHGQNTKGKVLAVGQGATFAVSAVSLGVALSLRGPDGRYSAQDAPTARAFNVSYLVGAYAFAALYAYGVLDGLLSPPPLSHGGGPG
ncbi:MULTISPECIES: hypothetical protein [unclassified Corallococcus]|uniref:hypothetical protein n=1 Tax=unclassified Corallococcus TaxID=2685029 RepID=UPI001A8C3B8C|nr:MULTISPECIES: hypothetical protein [unclassified Corallococcus]MBN9685700.1 hypothetical protein [Corallococcus sp. NCSPR001]WAS82855.1 hypothetical protein O0N60_26445 [Corallococcus sp. NCRR]